MVRQMNAGRLTVIELCRRFKISRQTAYKWRRRYRHKGLWALQDHSRRPRRLAHQTAQVWLRRLRRKRLAHPTWGARKLRHELVLRFGHQGAPALATISRWLQRWGLSRGRRRRRRGPVLLRARLRRARRPHEVWTVDFKGRYRVGDGTRVEPLTVRDLCSRYGLEIALLRTQSLAETRRVFARLFREQGVPERIRCDNGTPFGGGGPTGLTRLSAWWVKLGIAVEFITPGRPCENGAHEQFHRVYKAEVAARPARTVGAQQRRSRQWLRHYNHQRPHEALGMKSRRRYLRTIGGGREKLGRGATRMGGNVAGSKAMERSVGVACGAMWAKRSCAITWDSRRAGGRACGRSILGRCWSGSCTKKRLGASGWRSMRGRADTVREPLRCGSLHSPPLRGSRTVSAMC